MVGGVGFSPDGKHVALGLGADSVRVWEARTGKEVWRANHRRVAPVGIPCVAFAPRDGKYLLSGSGDGTARLWDAKTGKQVRRFRWQDSKRGDPRGVERVALSPDGKSVLAGGGAGR